MSHHDLSAPLAMAYSQLYTNEVVNPALLEAFAGTPRELFVPPHLQGVAYVDEELDIGEGRFLLSPLDAARMLQLAELQSTDRVLEIGCGSGYLSAVAAMLAKEVIAVDAPAFFIQTAVTNFKALARLNATALAVEQLTAGSPNQAPFDVIIISGAVEQVPQALLRQLTDGGRLACIHVQGHGGIGVAPLGRFTVIRRHGEHFAQFQGAETHVPRLHAFNTLPKFQFG